MKLSIKIASVFAAIVMLGGCSEKYTELYNLTPDQWYSEIISDIKNSDLESADKHYISMSSEHVASPLLEQILLILAQAHANSWQITILMNTSKDTAITALRRNLRNILK